MKKVVLASLLAVACAGPLAYFGIAQPAAAGQAAAGQTIEMSPEEGAAYNNARTQTTPAAQAAAWEAYLKAYPQSAVKASALQSLLFAYSQGSDNAKTLDAADRLLQVAPDNFYAYVFETTLRRQANDATASDYARKGLALTGTKGVSDSDFADLKTKGYPVFYSAQAADALTKKDFAGSIAAYKSELASVPVAQTEAVGLQLQDTFNLGNAYYTSVPPDYLNCAYFAGRAMFYAPEPYKTNWGKVATYCYHKYHGNNNDGFDAMIAVAKDNLTPPAVCPAGTPATPPPTCLNVTAAPKPEDIVSNLIATTPDLAALAISDKEYVLQNGKQADADKVFDTIKGKSVELPDVTVIEATADSLKVAVSEDAVQSGTPDFVFTMKEPLKTVPNPKDKITLSGTYASYTQTPLLITMSDGAVVVKTKAPVKKPAAATHHPAPRKK